MDQSLHRSAVAVLDEEISELQAKIAELKMVRQWHASHISIAETPKTIARAITFSGGGVISSEASVIEDSTLADAIHYVFTGYGQPMRPAEIVTALHELDYKTNMDRGALLNAVYTTMKRKPDVFEKLADAHWQLKEWETQGRER